MTRREELLAQAWTHPEVLFDRVLLLEEGFAAWKPASPKSKRAWPHRLRCCWAQIIARIERPHAH